MSWPLPINNNDNNKKSSGSNGDYKFTKIFINQSELVDLRELVSSMATKVFIEEEPAYGGGTLIKFQASSKAHVDYVLFEIEKINKKKTLVEKSLRAINDKIVVCETDVENETKKPIQRYGNLMSNYLNDLEEWNF